MRDPYEVLGVSKAASSQDIKKAYRRLAKKLHPDANIKDPKAAQKFAELNTAYEIVGDEAKRKAFDRGEIDGDGKSRFHAGFEGAGAGRGFGGDSHFESFTWGPDGGRRGGGREAFRGLGFRRWAPPRCRGSVDHHAGGGGAGRDDARAAVDRQG